MQCAPNELRWWLFFCSSSAAIRISCICCSCYLHVFAHNQIYGLQMVFNSEILYGGIAIVLPLCNAKASRFFPCCSHPIQGSALYYTCTYALQQKWAIYRPAPQRQIKVYLNLPFSLPFKFLLDCFFFRVEDKNQTLKKLEHLRWKRS